MNTELFDRLDACWQIGYEAYERNMARMLCFYTIGSPERKAWEEGWDRAQEEYEGIPEDDQ